jgi:hypothetical protein
MLKPMAGSPKRLLMMSLSTFVIALFMLITVGFAWFSFANKADTSLISQIGNVDADYQFYIYLDTSRHGDAAPVLSNQCSSSSDDACYYLIENTNNPLTEPVYVFGSSDLVVPGNKFSFALKVSNTGNIAADLALNFLNIISTGFDFAINKTQIAYQYQVTRITYTESGYETGDIKSSYGIVTNTDHFLSNYDESYALASNIPLALPGSSNSSVIVYFDIYFDPDVSGFTELGVPTDNSNAFENQTFTISKIALILTKQE